MKLWKTLIAATTALVLAAPSAHAEEKQAEKKKEEATAAAAAAPEQPAKSWLSRFSGQLIYENAVGMGSFTTDGDSAQPYWNMSYSLRLGYLLHEASKLRMSLRLDMDQNIVENYASANTRPNQFQLYDIRLSIGQGSFLKLVADDFGPRDDKGVRQPVLSVDWSATLYFPTSKTSELSNKYLGIGAGLTTHFTPVSWLDFRYGFGATKNFNRYTNQVLDTSSVSNPTPSRANGAENVADGLVALGGANLEWALSHDIGLDFSWGVGLGDMGFTLGWTYFQNFTYANFTVDEFSSEHANPGRGYSDLMRGVVEVSWTPIPYFSVALGWLVDQTPKNTSDGSFRFPWWDTTNGADNVQSFYLDLVASF